MIVATANTSTYFLNSTKRRYRKRVRSHHRLRRRSAHSDPLTWLAEFAPPINIKMLSRVCASSRFTLLSGARAFSAAPEKVVVSMAQIKELRELTGAPISDCKKALMSEGANVKDAVVWLRKKGMAVAGDKSGRAAAQGLVCLKTEKNFASIVELNSETDFVARNDKFQNLLGEVTNLSLNMFQASGASSDAEAQSALMDAALPGYDCSVRESVGELVGQIRENITLRRIANITVQDGVVAGYVHNSLAPGMGQVASVVGLNIKGGVDALDAAGQESVVSLGRKLAMHVVAAQPEYLTPQDVPEARLNKEREIIAEAAAGSGKSEAIIAKMVEGRMSKFYQSATLQQQDHMLEDGNPRVSKVLAAAGQQLGVGKDGLSLAGFVRFKVGEKAKEDEE